MAKFTYVFEAVRWGRDIKETATSERALLAILDRWLVWDEEGGYMRCSPDWVKVNGRIVIRQHELYDYSHGGRAGVRRALKNARNGGV